MFNPHFFDAGEEGGGFEAEEFGSPTCSVDFPVGLFEGRFDIGFFTQAHVFFGENLVGVVLIFFDRGFE